MKIDLWDFRLWLAIPFIVLVCSVVLMYQFIYLPAKAQSDEYKVKYPDKCIVQRNQTVIQLNENDRETLYHPIMVCQVLLGQEPDENNTLHYFVQYQYESQAKYNKTHDIYSLSCKPKNFDDISGNFICLNGTIAKEKWIYE